MEALTPIIFINLIIPLPFILYFLELIDLMTYDILFVINIPIIYYIWNKSILKKKK